MSIDAVKIETDGTFERISIEEGCRPLQELVGGWRVTIDDIKQGLVTVIEMTAKRKCGRTESLTAYEFPAGWRMSEHSNVPEHVRRQALQLAREVWGGG